MAGTFDGTSFDGSTGGFDVDAEATVRHTGEPYHDPRIMRDDEEMMKTAVLFVALID